MSKQFDALLYLICLLIFFVNASLGTKRLSSALYCPIFIAFGLYILPRRSKDTLVSKLLFVTFKSSVGCGSFLFLIVSVTEKDFCRDSVTEINNHLRHLKSTDVITLRFLELDLKTLRFVVYSNRSYASRKDKSSQLAMLFVRLIPPEKCLP